MNCTLTVIKRSLTRASFCLLKIFYLNKFIKIFEHINISFILKYHELLIPLLDTYVRQEFQYTINMTHGKLK